MKKFIAAFAVFALAATAALAVSFTSPGAGTPQRKAMLDAMRPSIERTLGAPVEFVVEEIRVGGGWAFVRATPQRKGPGPALRNPDEEADGLHTEAVLRLQGGRWVVQEMVMGSTDVWFLGWCDKTPKGLLGQWCT